MSIFNNNRERPKKSTLALTVVLLLLCIGAATISVFNIKNTMQNNVDLELAIISPAICLILTIAVIGGFCKAYEERKKSKSPETKLKLTCEVQKNNNGDLSEQKQ